MSSTHIQGFCIYFLKYHEMSRRVGSGAAKNPGESACGASQRLNKLTVKSLFYSGAGLLLA
jgi:hypothetical protein